MNKLFIILTSLVITASALGAITNQLVTQLLLSNPNHMSKIEAELKSILPRLKMEFTSISVNASQSQYAAVVTYRDTAKGTFFNPNFGSCSLLVRGKVISSVVITVDSIREDDCGE